MNPTLILLPLIMSMPVEIPQWQPHDFEFRSDTLHENPFLVRIDGHFTGPDGRKMVVTGFYDGGGVWKIRFSPTMKGEWSLTTSSDDAKLSGKAVAGIQCVAQPNAEVHGILKVDPEHRQHFVFEDGSRFFLMGYECDWLWALDENDLNPFLDKLAEHGFNYIILNVYAHDTSWRTGKSEKNDYGPPPTYPWLGTNDQPDHERLNPDFWRHYDRVIEAMHKRGIIAHIMTKVYNKSVNWPAKRSPAEELYYRTLVARYSAYPNVVWDFSKEAHYETDFDYKADKLRFIRASDAYKHPITVHHDEEAYDRGAYSGLLDYRSDQHHGDWHATILRQRGMREWPVVNVEFGYERGPKGEGDHTYPHSQSPEEVVRRAWEIYMAGGYGAYYYTYTAWDVIHPEHNPPGYAHFHNLRRFFEGTQYWRLQPNDGLVSRGYCLANPGREYVVYQQDPGHFTVEVSGAESSLASEWFHPLTGKRVPAGTFGNGKHEITTPEGWNGPAVLHTAGP